MSSEPEVMEYESLEDLENTIEQVYDRVDRLDKEMEILSNEVAGFLNYEHDPDMLRGSAEYVEDNIQDEALARIAIRYAGEELENPEEAENWQMLEEAVEKATGMEERYRNTYQTLWNEFGFRGEKLNEKIEGRFPLNTFLGEWEDKPHRFFQDQETYDRDEDRFVEPSGPTMARYLDIEGKEQTGKQKDDMARERELNKEREGPRPEIPDQILRNQFNQGDRENPFSDARWVNQELLMLQNTIEGTPAAFKREKKKA